MTIAWRPRDPGLASLRRAARVAVVAPIVFAWYLEVADEPTAAMFAVFCAFALLGFADFGGAPGPRTRAYLVLTATGAVLLVLGTVLNPVPVAAALVAVVVAAAARFAGCFGGYLQASVSPVVLAFVLGATVPEGPGGSIGTRVVAWIAAGVLSAVAALVLWPRRERLVLRARVGRAAAALALGVRDVGRTGRVSPEQAQAISAEVGLMERSLVQPRRPAGPSAHDVVFVYAADQVRRLATFVLDTAEAPAPEGGLTPALAHAAADALDAAAECLTTGRLPPRLEIAVSECLARRLDAISAPKARIEAGADASAVVDAVDATFAVRQIVFLAASLATNAATLAGGTLRIGDSPVAGSAPGPLEVPATHWTGALRRLRELLATHLVPTSTWAQDSLRAGCAVGAAVAVALLWDLQHGFWVVLGTLSVLRSNAFSTGRTALDAAVGTAIGFAVSAVVLAFVGFDHFGLWVVVVLSLFLSAYAPQALGFVAGQVCFTVLVVALFNLIDPEGWRTGLVRFEDIIIGVIVSAVVALLFWPRRAVHELRATVSAAFAALGEGLGPAFRGAPDSAPVHRAERRAHAAYEGYLSEQLGAPPAERPWAVLLATASQGRGAIVTLERHPELSALEATDPLGAALGEAADGVASGCAALADRIAAADPGVMPPDAAWDPEAVAARTRPSVTAAVGAHEHDGPFDGALEAALAGAFARDGLVALASMLVRASRAATIAAGPAPSG